MRNPLRSFVARPAGAPSLRERFKATREKYAGTLRGNRALNAPLLAPVSDLDAAIVTAAGDLVKIEAAITLLLKDESRDADRVPGYSALDDERDEMLDALSMEKARTLAGLQAKARTLLSRDPASDPSWIADLGASLARDLIDANGRAIEPQPDPIFALIEEARRLDAEWSKLLNISCSKPDDHPDNAITAKAHTAMWEHVRGVLLKTVPNTAAGCVALARFACEFTEAQGVPLDYESNDLVLSLIARSPAL